MIKPRRPALRALAVPAAIALLLVLGFWAGRVTITDVSAEPAGSAASSGEAASWTTNEVSIGRTLTFSWTISDVTVPGPYANGDGTVTAVGVAGSSTIDSGSRLYEVNLRPTTAAVGDVPAFRALQLGDRGQDVTQLRAFLCSSSYLRECRTDPTYTQAMTVAVTRWQKDLGVAQDGVVQPSDLMYFASLPIAVRPAADFSVGQRMTSSTRPLLVLAGAPTLVLRVTQSHAELVPVGVGATFGTAGQGVTGPAVPSPTTSDAGSQDGGLDIPINAPDGTSVCTATTECTDLLGGQASAVVQVAVQVIPAQTGTGVPIQAIQTRPDETTFVRTPDGIEIGVTVVGSSGGMALVTGLDVGQVVLVDAEDD